MTYTDAQEKMIKAECEAQAPFMRDCSPEDLREEVIEGFIDMGMLPA